MRNTAFVNTANAIINSVREELTEERDKVFKRIDETKTSILNALTSTSASDTSTSDDSTSVSSLTEKANSTITTNDKIQIEILKLLKEIQTDMKTCKPTGNDDNKKGKKRPKRRTDTRFYCWSCGAWNHKSKDCRRKKEGHRDDATFEDKKGGSTYYCPRK